jgi:hypothetical protein
MADFSDVARFTQQHLACGEIVPSVTTQRGGGYLLTLSCRCGATFDRWVTPEDAKSAPIFTGAPAPPSAPEASTPAPSTPEPPSFASPPQVAPPSPSRRTPRATPSPELEAAMREALEAETTTPSTPPAPSRPRPPARSGELEGPKLTPSPELEAAVREALAAEVEPTPPPPAPPAPAAPVGPPAAPTPPASIPPASTPSPAPPPMTREAARQAARDAARESGRAAPSKELEAAMRAALQAETAPAPAQRPSGRGRLAPAKLDLESTVRAALKQQQLMRQGGVPTETLHKRPTNATAWIVIALLSLAAGAGGVWYIAMQPENEPEIAMPAGTPIPGGGPAAPSRPAGSLQDAVEALRSLQNVSGPSISLPTYQAKLVNTQATVGTYLDSDAPTDMKRNVREILDLHLLAGAAWQARALDTAESWNSISRSPSLRLCTAVQQAADAAERSGQNNAQARGRAVAAAIPELWQCAATRLAQLPGGAPR